MSDRDLDPLLATQLPTWARDHPIAVRSSALSEDRGDASAAGVYTSVLDVRGVPAIASAVREVRDSLHSARAQAYHAAVRDDDLGDRMAVVVQRQVRCDVGGVLMTNGHAVVVEALDAARGGVRAVVDGSATPDRYRRGSQAGQDAGSGGCLARGELERVAETGVALARLLDVDVDVEWAVEKGRLWVLQVRPVSAPVPAPPTGAAAGVGGSPGTITGPARVVVGVDDFGKVRPGDVLVCPSTDPGWTPLLSIAGALVTEVGGVLSHAAIVARELSVPAVVGLEGACSRFTDGQLLTVDGSRGTVSPAG